MRRYKLTRKILNEHNIYNSYNLAKAVNSPIYLDYIPADNGRLTSHYPYWQWRRFTDNGERTKDFTVTHREAKEPVLQEAIALVKKHFGIDVTDKDPFGGYHPQGTIEKLCKIMQTKKSS